MPVVVVPAPYRGPTQGKAEIRVAAGSVRACLEAVECDYPGILELILAEDGLPHRFVKLFINEQQMDSRALDAPLAEDDRLEILAAIAGG